MDSILNSLESSNNPGLFNHTVDIPALNKRVTVRAAVGIPTHLLTRTVENLIEEDDECLASALLDGMKMSDERINVEGYAIIAAETIQ